MALRFMFAFSIQRQQQKSISSHQSNQSGSYKNRYDVTLLVNGLPLVQIELKRSGIEIKEAFNQINRYHSFLESRSVSIRAIVCDQQ
jgi:type I site-specific restriction-modification system R (restriction) subunit